MRNKIATNAIEVAAELITLLEQQYVSNRHYVTHSTHSETARTSTEACWITWVTYRVRSAGPGNYLIDVLLGKADGLSSTRLTN